MSETDKLLEEREKTHGDFTKTAFLIQLLKISMRTSEVWETLSSPQKESLEMIANKIGRILSGNPNLKDHWDNIAGYAQLVARTLE